MRHLLLLFPGFALALAPLAWAADAGRLSISLSGTNAMLSWTNSAAVLEQALDVLGPWSEVSGAHSNHIAATTNAARFFRLRRDAPPTDIPHLYLPPSYFVLIGAPASSCGCVSPGNPNSSAGTGQDNGMGTVLLHTGELVQNATDLVIPGRGFDWRFERHYRSGMNYEGPLGQRWEFNYNSRLFVETNGDVLRMDGMGRADRYVISNSIYLAPSGYYTRLTRNTNDGTFVERDRHGTVTSYSATNALAVARLTRIQDRNSNAMTFQYNARGQLTNVVDTLSRSIRYNYDTNGHLSTVVDFSGRTLQFSYDARGDLISATGPAVTGTPTGNDFPTGKTTRYNYSSGFADARLNHNLLTCTMPNEVATNGPPKLVATYVNDASSTNAGRVQSLTVGGTNGSGIPAGGTIRYSYLNLGSVPANDFVSPVFQNTATNRNGNVREYQFNQLGNVVRARQFTRGLRAGEPLFFETQSEYNKDGEMTRRIQHEGNSTENTFDSANADRFQQGNLTQVRHLPGSRGGDQSQIVTSNSYETNFNFAATSTDGRSNVTRHYYDARGNRTNTVHRISSITEDFEYNTFGQMTARTLPDNGSAHRRRDVMSYYSSGPQTGYVQSQIVDSSGFNLTTTYEYDSVGNIVRTVDARGNDTLLTLNALNQVVRESSRAVSTPSGLVRYERDFHYDANNNLVRTDVQNRDDTGAIVSVNPAFTTTSTYNILNDLLSTSQEVDSINSVVTAYSYDANQNRVLTRFGEATAGRQIDNVVQRTYDERDLSFRETRAPGSAIQSTTQYDYDRNRNLSRTSHGTEDVIGVQVTTYAYDGYERRTSVTDPMGNVTSYHYDGNGNSIARRIDGELTEAAGGAGNVRLSEVTYQYDAMDRQIRQDVAHFDTQTQVAIGDGFSTTQWTYADNSQVTSRTDDNPGHVTATIYDTANRRLTVTDARANTTTYGYDANGNVIQTIETDKSDLGNPSQNFTTSFVYDELDRNKQRTDNVGNTQSFVYDSRGNRLLDIDARGNKIRYEYDGLNRLVKTSRDMDGNGIFTDPVDIIASQSWDDDSRLISRTDDNSHATTYQYDSLGRRTATIYADCTTDSTTYDVHDNAVSATDANGTRVTSAYDGMDRVTNKTVVVFGSGVAFPPLGTSFENFAYDGMSRLVRAEDNDSVVIRRYDSLSKIIQENQQITVPLSPMRTVTAQYDGEGNQTRLVYPGGRAVVRGYDLLDRPSIINDDPPAGPPIANYSYIGPYRVEQRNYPKTNPAQTIRFTPSYDGIRRTMSTLHVRNPNGVPVIIDQRAYDWDPNSNKTGAHRPVPAPPEDRFYTYDAANRLIQSQVIAGGPPTIIAYALDGAGNRTTVTGGPDAGPYTMNPALCEPGDFQMNQYTTTPLNSQSYDTNGNLTARGASQNFTYDYRNQLVQHVTVAPVQTTTYKYDCLGRRIEKSVNGVITRFYYDGMELIEEQDAANTTIATYVYSKGRHTRLQMVRSGQKYYYHEDDLGSVMKVTDASGSIVEGYSYGDYGKPTFFDSSGNAIAQSAIGNPWLFQDLRFDAETGLHHGTGRLLDSRAGRFIQRGWSGMVANAFSYRDENPVSGFATQDKQDQDSGIKPPVHVPPIEPPIWPRFQDPPYLPPTNCPPPVCAGPCRGGPRSAASHTVSVPCDWMTPAAMKEQLDKACKETVRQFRAAVEAEADRQCASRHWDDGCLCGGRWATHPSWIGVGRYGRSCEFSCSIEYVGSCYIHRN